MGQTDGRSSPSDAETEEKAPKSEARIEATPAEPIAPPNTLLNGASLQSTWRMPGLSDNSNLPIDVTPTSDAPGADGSGVHSRPTSAASGDADHRVAVIAPPNPVRDMVSGLADTQELKQRVDPPRRMVTNRKLGRTLRMELGISPVKLPPSAADNARARPRDDNARAKPRDDNARAKPRDDNARARPRDDNARDERLVPGATQRIGTNFDSSSSNERQPARSTDPFGRAGRGGSARPAAAGPPALPPKPAATGPSWQGAIGGPAPSQRAAGPAWAARSLAPAPASKRASRVGDKTIVTRRGSSTRDWLFIGLIVAALGVTASMLLSYRNENNASEAAAADATNVEHSVNAAADSPAKQNAATAPSNVTEIVSNPPNAEVVFGGAVIGNTPVRVARTNFDADYLVRLGGYDPQLVRVSSSSPSTIVVALKALAH